MTLIHEKFAVVCNALGRNEVSLKLALKPKA